MPMPFLKNDVSHTLGGQVSFGGSRVEIAFAGGPYHFSGLSRLQAKCVLSRFYRMSYPAIEHSPEAMRTQCCALARSVFKPIDTRGWEYRLDLDPSRYAIQVAGPNFLAAFDVPAREAFLGTCLDGGEEFVSVVENFLRVAASYRLLEAGGALLHSAGIVQEGRAAVFFGHSGAGKTTLSTLSRRSGREVLSDELNALELREGAVFVRKVPFAGDYGGATSSTMVCPLFRLCRLIQGSSNRLERMRPAEALASMVAASPFVNADPHRLDILVRNLTRLTSAAPTYAFHFCLDEPIWPMLGGAP